MKVCWKNYSMIGITVYMRIRIITVGKIKEAFYRDAMKEYLKRLQKYATVEIVEVADEKTIEQANQAQIDSIKQKEAQRILQQIKENSYVIALEINAKQMASEELAEYIRELGIRGKSSIVFIIGGSLGLHDSVLERADHTLSFSKLTYPHQLMRVILLEQVYRCFRINSNEPYHK